MARPGRSDNRAVATDEIGAVTLAAWLFLPCSSSSWSSRSVIAIALLLVLFSRKPESALEGVRLRIEQALREEQRDGRGELRQQLDSLSTQQEQRIDGFASRLNEAARAPTSAWKTCARR